jgi:NAD(P)-dependent dehydrogenase (short-subunit alcohol dehydrogenase family)
VEYQGRTAVVTGAGSGLGKALALELAARGAELALSDIDGPGLEDTVRRCQSAAGRIRAFELDVSDRHALLAHADEVESAFGAVNLVINNAGVAVVGTVEDTSFDDLDWLLGINLMGVINGSKAFLPGLIRSGDGHLVNISSVFGLVAPAYQSAYCAAKFGVRGYTESLRQEMLISGHPVSVHCVHPGGVKTNIARRARYADGPNPLGPDPAQRFDRVARTTPDVAARKILAGVDRDAPRILVGTDAYIIAAIPRLLGARYVGLFGRAGRRAKRT